jgi:hypothetical protein
VFVCAHPKDWGHGTPPDYRHHNRTEAREAEQAAAALRDYQRALAVADDARASFLTDYLTGRGKAPAGTLRTALDLLGRTGGRYGASADRAEQLLQPTCEADGRPDDEYASTVATRAGIGPVSACASVGC